jgi:hypothetical protein
MRPNRHALAGLAGAAALLVGGGAALAGQGGGDPSSRCEAVLAKVAAKRGVTAAQLQARLEARLLARVDAAEQAGKITSAQAAELKQRIEQGSVCKALRPLRVRFGLLARAAHYLGLTGAELRSKLPGTSLAAIAQGQGKSVEGLETAMLAPLQARIAKAVANQRLTQKQADMLSARLTTLVNRLVQRTFPAVQ